MTLANAWENAKVASPSCAKSAEEEYVDEPEQGEGGGRQPPPEGAGRDGGGRQHGRDALGDRHAPHPFDSVRPARGPPRAAGRWPGPAVAPRRTRR